VRVVLVNKFAYVTGGADLHTLGLAELLRSRGHDVALLSTASDRNLATEGAFVPLGVTHASREALGAGGRARVLAEAFWNRRAAAAMRRLVADRRPDVVHAHMLYPQLSVAPLRAARRAGVPVVQTVHDYELIAASGLDHRGGRVDRHEQRLEFRVLRTLLHPVRQALHVPAVDAWVAVSRYVAERYGEHGIHAEVLPNFIEPPPDALPGFADREGALFIGRLTEAKGVRDALEVARLAPELPVTIAGGGPLEDEVASAARRQANLTFLGWLDREAVAEALSRARVLLLPSRWAEPGALAVLEAMRAGTPLAAYPEGGAAQYVADAGAGRVVPFGADGLAAAARELATDPAAWGEASDAGLHAVRTTHAPATYAAALERVYERAIAAAGRSRRRRRPGP
jgi:glycosyltransferase involved in cell wall biosynthesis